ncbi:MAG: DUF6088 family protein [Bacteriovoracia bacterium]
MTVAKEVKQKILSMEEGRIITYEDFAYLQNFNAVSLVLSRLAKEGVIQRLEKGKYFKPKKSKFGTTGPGESEIIKSLIDEGYVSGSVAYNKLGLTTQVPNEVTIIGKKYNRKTKIGKLSIRYQKREGSFNNKSRKYLQILDAIKDIKRIPGAGINETLRGLIRLIGEMSETEQERLVKYGIDYKPMVRALLGAIMEKIGNTLFESLQRTLNPLTSYNVGIDEKILPNKDRWRIR